jgi:hypothetical protein
MDYRLCKICSEEYFAPYKSYPKLTCSKKCAQTLIRQNNLEKYGVENPQQLLSVREKTKKTNLEKYGVESFLQSDLKKSKSKKTNLEKYGCEHALQSEDIKQKQKNTNLIRYGVDNPQKLDVIKQKSKSTRLEKYGVEHMLQNPESKEKLIITSLNRYGVENYSQTDNFKSKYKSTSVERYGVDNFNKKHISPETLSIIDNIDWLEEQAKSSKSIKSISDEIGISLTCLYRRFSKNNIIPRRFKQSSTEEEIYNFLSKFCDDIIVGSRKLISPKEIDIYLPSNKLAFEINGIYWHCEISGNKNKEYHVNKTEECKNLGIDLIHISDIEWKYKPDIIKSIILSKIGKLDKIYARKCKLSIIDKETEKLFLNNNHLQGYIPSKYCYGLHFNDELVSLISFGKNRFKKNSTELLRFCNKTGISVIGGASKLFQYFVNNNKIDNIISYSHRDKFIGSLYSRLGFIYNHTSTPSYYYTTDYNLLENRMKYQKHKLEKLLPIFDPLLTEWQNMQNNGYDRIWDCGNDVWEWTR